MVGFTCQVGDRTIIGEVKEKEKARAVFKEAIARGETAGLLEQLPDAADVFTTTVGNVPPGAKVIINITYLGELKHDMEIDGIRFTIPNVICPRYGNYPGTLRTTPAIDAQGSGISIIVDAEMADGSFIQKIQSPTHPISMTMGTTSVAPNAEPTMSKASATLTLGTTQLDADFVVQIIARDTGIPTAILENHPTVPNHRALMATLVPKFALPAEKPEIVFVCDRSGSMGGSRIILVIQALKVFLKSLPVGVKFNICSFGSFHSFLWPKSVTYSQQTLDEAMHHAETFGADYGGTEMLQPLKDTIEQRYKDMPLDVMMLTDGETWNQEVLFKYLNQSIAESKAPVRIFTLGIGNGVSHALIEGVAKAGNGFSQTVGEGERMDTKVVRMLKGALSPHINDYTLEVKYVAPSLDNDEDDFEITEKVNDSLRVKLDLEEKEVPTASNARQSDSSVPIANIAQKKPISLFDTSMDVDMEEPPVYDETVEERYSHLPKVLVPKIIQAPQNIPSLFAFNRTTAYLLLGPDAPQATPISVILRGTSTHGPLELEIPIQVLGSPGETIHQLAAKKAISELEQGRGWLPETKDDYNTLLKSKFEGSFSDMVEREAVRLGVQFQVGGKWCSFVAVESNKQNVERRENEVPGWEWLEDEKPNLPSSLSRKPSHLMGRLAKQMSKEVETQNANIHRIVGKSTNSKIGDQHVTQNIFQSPSLFTSKSSAPAQQSYSGPSRGGLFGSSSTTAASAQPSPSLAQGSPFGRGASATGLFGNMPQSQQRSGVGTMSGNFATVAAPVGQQAQLFGQRQQRPQQPLFGAASPVPSVSSHSQALQDYQMGLMILEQSNKNRLFMARQAPSVAPQGLFGHQISSLGNTPQPPPPPQALFGSNQAPAPAAQPFGGAPASSTLAFGGAPITSASASSFGAPDFGAPPGAAFGSVDLSMSNSNDNDNSALENFDFDSFLHSDEGTFSDLVKDESLDNTAPQARIQEKSDRKKSAPNLFSRFIPSRKSSTPSSAPSAPSVIPSIKTDEDLLHYLISLQTFSGSWTWSPELLELLKLDEALVRRIDGRSRVSDEQLATALVIAVFEEKLAAFTGSWELIVEKAREWLAGDVSLVDAARHVVKGI